MNSYDSFKIMPILYVCISFLIDFQEVADFITKQMRSKSAMLVEQS